MSIEISTETVIPMLELCKKHKQGNLTRSELEEELKQEDYIIEFERYNAPGLPLTHITKDEFIDYFMNILELDLEDINNERLKIRHPYFKDFFANLDDFEDKIKQLLSIDENTLKEGAEITYNGLPNNITFDNFKILFTISIGNSFGWPWPKRNCMHFDVIQFFKYCNLDDLTTYKSFMAHELHHLGFSNFLNTIDSSDFSLEDELYSFFAFEGLAVKYCNNGAGPLTKKIYKNIKSNIGMDDYTFKYFKDHFIMFYNELKSQIEQIRSGIVKDLTDIKNYWLSIYTHEQNHSEYPLLKHSANYYIGMNIWGIIHDIYGKEVLFEVLNNPKLFPSKFNDALKMIGRDDLFI